MKGMEEYAMAKPVNRLTGFLSVFLLFFPLLLCGETIHVLFSNDSHGIYRPTVIKLEGKVRKVGGFEAVSHYLDEFRSTHDKVLLIDTGDVMTGTMGVELKYQGAVGGVMIDFMNSVGYDAWCFGNHDFDRGQINILRLAQMAKFPKIMANIIYTENGRPFPASSYHIFRVGNLKVGVIAVMERNFVVEVLRESVKGLDVLPSIPLLNAYLPLLDRQTDLVIAVVHSHFWEGVEVAKHVPGIDCVLVASEDGRFEKVGDVLVKSTVGHQNTLGRLTLEVEDDRVVDYEEDLIWLWADVPLNPSPGISERVQRIDRMIGKEYRKRIGFATADYLRKPGTVETELGNWITDAMRWKTGSQIAFHNTGAIRAGLLEGTITKGDIFKISPFNNILYVFYLNGRQIKGLLEYDVEKGYDRLQVSGLKYTHYTKEEREKGRRVDWIEINGDILVEEGKLLLPEKEYRVVTNNYVIGQAEDKYFGFSVKRPFNTHLSVMTTLVDWLKKHRFLTYEIEGRILKKSRPLD
jgi:5'-nucleotidase/UDP-sugar diphosphatase